MWIGLAIHPNGNSALRALVCENAETLAERVVDEELDVLQFPLNWLVGRKNLLESHRRAVGAKRPTSHEELAAAFSD